MKCQVRWLILGICALHLTHPKCTHTAVNTHSNTVNTHPEQWAAIYAAVPGKQSGVQCPAQGHLVVVLRAERALDIHCMFYQKHVDWRSDPHYKDQYTSRQYNVNIITQRLQDYRPLINVLKITPPLAFGNHLKQVYSVVSKIYNFILF